MNRPQRNQPVVSKTSAASTTPNSGPLKDIRVLDLTRILAGPSLTQILGDFGADVIKVERPGTGDDTRQWGPPYVASKDGDGPGWSSYYLCANRNKRSIAVDITSNQGQKIIRALAQKSDVLIENFKAGGLKKYRLGYEDLKREHAGLVYCSITGFGQTGPLSHRPGYDAMIQAMGGIMSITGAPDGDPMKVGVGISDLMCGMYAGLAILSALRHRDLTGDGQYIDVSLFDTQLAWLINEGMNYLVSGDIPRRRGTAHPNIVPYQVFPTSDGHFMLAVGNDGQFRRFCEVAGAGHLGSDPKYATNPARLENRDELVAIIRDLTKKQSTKFWVGEMDRANVPAGPINDIAQAFDEPQTEAREMRLTMHNKETEGGEVDLIANPVKFSATEVSYRHFPPELGEHSQEILRDLLDLSDDEIAELETNGVLQTLKKDKEKC